MKKIISLALVFTLLFCAGLSAKAEEIAVVYNGEPIWFDAPPRMINNRVMVPMRAIFETVGATVEWQEETQSVKAVTENTIVTFKIGDNFIVVNGKTVNLDAKIEQVNDRTFVPVRAIAEAFDNNVFWSSKLNRVFVTDYTIVDLLGQPLYLIEYLFGGDYEYCGFLRGGSIIKYTDNRIPVEFSRPYIEDPDVLVPRIGFVRVSGFCKIANGFYGGMTRNELEKKGYHGKIIGGDSEFKDIWNYGDYMFYGKYQDVKADLTYEAGYIGISYRDILPK